MNEELEFRAWHNEFKTMIDWETIKQHHDLCGLIESRHTVEQYTGMKTQNGEGCKVFKGDILFDAHSETHHEVVFKEGCFYAKGSCHASLEDMLADSDVDVVGNIHENADIVCEG